MFPLSLVWRTMKWLDKKYGSPPQCYYWKLENLKQTWATRWDLTQEQSICSGRQEKKQLRGERSVSPVAQFSTLNVRQLSVTHAADGKPLSNLFFSLYVLGRLSGSVLNKLHPDGQRHQCDTRRDEASSYLTYSQRIKKKNTNQVKILDLSTYCGSLKSSWLNF